MRTTRRRFVSHGITSLCALGAASRLPIADDQADASAAEDRKAPDCLDYGLSFLCNPKSFNSVRFWVESRTTIVDEASGDSSTFYQCASCKSEDTFAETDLFLKDNYDFLPIFGGHEAEDLLIFRRHARLTDRYRTVTKSEKLWGKPILKLHQGAKVKVLESWESIRDATAAGTPIVSQTEIRNDQTKLRAIIECPVKTMNISLDRKVYQVDTGPIALPDLTKKADPLIACLSLAFIAFNAPHFADFVVEQPTAVVENEEEKCKIHHYSGPVSFPAKNTLLAVGPS